MVVIQSTPTTDMDSEYFPFNMIHHLYNPQCIPYPTFAQLLARLDDLQPNFGWQEKLSQPLIWLYGNRSLDSIKIDRLDYAMPKSLCILFDIPPTWVLAFCEVTLLALEDARAQAKQLHCDGHQYCCKCGGYFKVHG